MDSKKLSTIENEVLGYIQEVKAMLKIETPTSLDSCPGNTLRSPVLFSVMVRIGYKLGMNIPINCYIFQDKCSKKQLSIREASKRLLKEAT